MQSAQAAKEFRRIRNIAVARYYLAKISDFMGNQNRAKQIIDTLYKNRDLLTVPAGIRVSGFKAKLDFNFTEQIKFLKELTKRSPYNKETYFELGEAYFHHGKANPAVHNYNEALRLDPNYSQAVNHLGYCYSYLGEHIKAIKTFEKYRNLDGRTANSLDSLGDGYFYYGKLNEAVSMKRSAFITSDQEASWAFLTISDIYVLQSQYQKALTELDKYRDTLLKLKRLDKRTKSVIFTKRTYIRILQRSFKRAEEL